MDWLDLLAVQGTLKSLLQHHSSKASIPLHSAFFIVQLSHPYMTTGKTIALTRQSFGGKIMSLLFNIISRLVITFLPRSKSLSVSWLQSPSAVIFSSVQFSRSVVSNSLRPNELQHLRPPCPSPTPEFTQTHVRRVGDAIQPSHLLLSPSSPAPNPSQHQGLFK